MFGKILVPHDGSEISSKVFPQIVELAKACSSEITLIYVFHTDQAWELWGGAHEMLAEITASARKNGEAILAQAGKEIMEQGLEAKLACVEGLPAREIIKYADENEMDLIAMATHGRGEVAWVLGSVAEQVVTHANVPVLLFRAIKTQPLRTKEEISIPFSPL